MAADCTQEAVLDFLREKGGKVRNADLVERFRSTFPEEPNERAAVQNRFKRYVDHVASVKAERGVRYVCLKKRFRGSAGDSSVGGTNGSEAAPEKLRYPDRVDRVPVSDAVAPGGDAQRTPGSGYGNERQVRAGRLVCAATILPEEADDDSEPEEPVCVEQNCGEMGNRGSCGRGRTESKKERVREAPEVPRISVVEASPLPVEASVFRLPGPVQTGATGPDGHVDTGWLSVGVTGHQNSKGSGSEEGMDGPLDAHSLCGSEGSSSPRGSRRHFMEAMLSSSPQLRRDMGRRGSVCPSSRSDGDSASLVSSNVDEDHASVTLDPLEHEWMMCASDGEWASLSRLLGTEPGLLLRRDFVTGFTCLHWAAKHGKPELLALIINFAQQNNVPISVDVRSNNGYTPLHIAAMHSHMEVVKLLVGAYSADVEVRDYSGRKAGQYLSDIVSLDIRDIIGAYERSESENIGRRDSRRWRFSTALQSNLRPVRPRPSNACDPVDGEGPVREKHARRKSSFSRLRPKLEKLRLRTSRFVHRTSFWDTEEQEEPVKDALGCRPSTSLG